MNKKVGLVKPPCFSHGIRKRGISAIVATVLIILVIATAAAIIWVAIIPMIRENFATIDPDTRVNIDTSEGYTNYDAGKNLLSVHVRRYADESDMTGVRITVLFDGGTQDIELGPPPANQKVVYVINLSETGHINPVSISVSAIVNVGRESRESVASEKINIPDGNIINIPGTLYAFDGSVVNPTCTISENPESTCTGGVDNDCDGQIDCADSDCSADAACIVCTPTETPEATCDDGLDNDCDNDVDCADVNCAGDAACTCPDGTCAAGENCALDSSDCDTPTLCRSGVGACSNGCFYVAIGAGGQDNGRCDDSFMAGGCTTLPCECDGLGACVERTCGDLSCTITEECSADCSTETYCGDSTDNDEDGDVDCADSDCSADALCTCPDGTCDAGENCGADSGVCNTPTICRSSSGACTSGCTYPPLGVGTEDAGLCTNTGLGCATSFCECDGLGSCVPGTPPTCPGGGCVSGEECAADCATETYCDDGADNDQNTFTDCADSDCFGDGVCCSDGLTNGDETGQDCGGSCVSGSETGQCTGEVDNDNDCLVDCADPDCSGDAACSGGGGGRQILFFDDFESEIQCGTTCDSACNLVTSNWVNTETNHWLSDVAGGGSSSTGPSTDHTLGTSLGHYLVTEGSSCYNRNYSIESPNIDTSSYPNLNLEFWYHMFGGYIVSLNVDIYESGSWTNSVWSLSGQQQTAETDPYLKASVDLSSYSGVIKIRIRAVSHPSQFASDIAIDDINITYEVVTTDYTSRSCNVDGSATGGVCSSPFYNKTEDTTDGTIDSCTDGTSTIAMWVYNIYVNATTVLTTDTIEVTCDLKCWTSGGEYGIYYKNSSAGSTWQHVQDGGCVTSNTKTANIPMDDVTGTHYIRCWEKHGGVVAACPEDDSYGDSDDMSIEVI